MSTRDFQRSRVYKAEQGLGKYTRSSKPLPHLRTVAQCQAWIDKITRSRWWKARAVVSKVAVFDGRGTVAAAGGHFGDFGKKRGWGVSLPLWARREEVILHELAHVMTPYDTQPAHGRAFCKNYLALIHRWMSKEKAAELRDSFRKQRVKWRAKNT